MKFITETIKRAFSLLSIVDPEIALFVQSIYLIQIAFLSPHVFPNNIIQYPLYILATTQLIGCIWGKQKLVLITCYLHLVVYVFLAVTSIRHPEYQCQAEYPLATAVAFWCILRLAIEYIHTTKQKS